jgi:serine/threonine protein kinase
MKENPHPLIAKLIDDFIDSDGHQCLVLERYNDGDFSKYLNDRQGELLSEKEILRFLANIFLAVFHINSRDIFHRDLKPANFLKKEVNGKIYLHLSDFGISKNIRDKERQQSSTNNVKGTLEYLSPEAH